MDLVVKILSATNSNKNSISSKVYGLMLKILLEKITISLINNKIIIKL